jgi:hypothetical protein
MANVISIDRRGFLGRTVAALAAVGTANVTAIAATRPAAAEDRRDKCWAQLILGLPLARSIARLTKDAAV